MDPKIPANFFGSDTVSCPSSRRPGCTRPPPTPSSQQPATRFLVENKKTKGHIQTSPNRFGFLSVRPQRACIGWRRASARLVRSLVGNSLFFLLSPRCVAWSSEKKKNTRSLVCLLVEPKQRRMGWCWETAWVREDKRRKEKVELQSVLRGPEGEVTSRTFADKEY